ncbi:MAG: hypothetical protein RL410_557 [Actinomycetota bacterium]
MPRNLWPVLRDWKFQWLSFSHNVVRHLNCVGLHLYLALPTLFAYHLAYFLVLKAFLLVNGAADRMALKADAEREMKSLGVSTTTSGADMVIGVSLPRTGSVAGSTTGSVTGSVTGSTTGSVTGLLAGTSVDNGTPLPEPCASFAYAGLNDIDSAIVAARVPIRPLRDRRVDQVMGLPCPDLPVEGNSRRGELSPNFSFFGGQFPTLRTNVSDARHKEMSSSKSVTKAAIGERSERVNVTWAKSG